MILTLALIGLAMSATVELTGHARRNFRDSGALTIFDAGDPEDGGDPDVVIPPELFGDGEFRSGLDITEMYFLYDEPLDQIQIGFDCFGVCGDVDGNDNDGGVDEALVQLGVVDYPDMGGSETVILFLDFDLNVANFLPSFAASVKVPWDVVIGVPGGQPNDSTFLPCQPQNTTFEVNFNATSCFGIYEYNQDAASEYNAFLKPLDVEGVSIINNNPLPDEDRPSWEWTLRGVNKLRVHFAGVTEIPEIGLQPFQINGAAFTGSNDDGGIGVDYVPARRDFFTLEFPCLKFDECNLCFGDNSTCKDCMGVPNGSSKVDECGVCDGPGGPCPTTTTEAPSTTTMEQTTETVAVETTQAPTTTATTEEVTSTESTTVEPEVTTVESETEEDTQTQQQTEETVDGTAQDPVTQGDQIGSQTDRNTEEITATPTEEEGSNIGVIVGFAVMAFFLLLAMLFCYLTGKVQAERNTGSNA